jgi:hypothetical protein
MLILRDFGLRYRGVFYGKDAEKTFFSEDKIAGSCR